MGQFKTTMRSPRQKGANKTLSTLVITNKEDAAIIWQSFTEWLEKHPPEDVSTQELLKFIWNNFVNQPGTCQVWLAVDANNEDGPRIVGHMIVWSDYWFSSPFLSVFSAFLERGYTLSQEQRVFFVNSMQSWGKYINEYCAQHGYECEPTSLRFLSERRGFQRYLSKYLPKQKTRTLHTFALC